MKDFPIFRSMPRLRMRALAATGLDLTRRAVALSLVWLLMPLGVADVAFAQQAPPPPPDASQQAAPPQDQSAPPPAQDQTAPPPPQDQAPQAPAAPDQGAPADQGQPPQQYNALSPEQLNQLVAPIALYPDSLVAQVLAASTYPTQIVDADRFVQSHPGVPPDQMAQMVNGQQWDPSVKALAAFPSVLSNMDKNLDWATQLGNAYYNQPQDVMSAVQNDRQQAYNDGKLRSTPQLNVTDQPGDIAIEPANPAVVYVPYYNPWQVWGWGNPWFAWYAPPPPPGYFMGVGVGFGFGLGIAIGAWGHWGWGWGHWGMGWGPHPYVGFGGRPWVSRSFTVVNHGYYGHFDRNPEARAWNQHTAFAAHAAYNRGYANGARNGFNNGARTGYNAGARQGYNAGARQGYNAGVNRGASQGYHQPQVNNGRSMANRPATNYNRPATNYNRPAQNYNRPAQNYNRPAQNYNRPAQNYNRPAQNYSRPQASRPAAPSHPAESHPSGGGHPAESHGGGGGHDGHGHR